MNILIDNPRDGWSHMVSDNIKDLHIFAERIGIKKCWYNNKRGKNQPHYDVRKTKLQEAINAGAKLVTRKELFLFLKENYESKK